MLWRFPPTEAALHLPLDKEGWWGRSPVTQVNVWGDVSEQTPAERENIQYAARASHTAAVRHFYYPFQH